MTETALHSALVWTVFALAVVTFAVLRRLKAPYGRHYLGKGWGPDISSRTGWIVMEMPAPLAFAGFYALGDSAGHVAPLVLLGVWQCHYLNRSFLYPLRLRTAGSRMPVVVVATGFAFNVLNGYINARFISHFGEYGTGWLTDPRFLVGLALFAAGFAMNIHSDNILLRLRGPTRGSDTTGYSIPRGGAFRWVSCPNYLGELLEWGGWALATWSPAGLAFFAYTAANLVPRALSHHRWYRDTFADYPTPRKAVIPGLL